MVTTSRLDSPSSTPHTPALRRRPGTGSLRERRPGVWEVRITSGRDPTTGGQQRSLTVHGTRADAERVAAGRVVPARRLPPAAMITLGDLLPAWLAADQSWKPSTRVGYTSVARSLLHDPIADLRVTWLTPAEVRAILTRWDAAGVTTSVAAGRVRAIRACLGWAHRERLIDTDLARTLRGPRRSPHRLPLDDDEVTRLLDHAGTALLEAVANGDERLIHRRQQQLLLVRLAADSGARRGELAALRIADLRGRVLRIERADSAGVLTVPKSGHGRSITLGQHTAEMWSDFASQWERRAAGELGPWLFSRNLAHDPRLQASSLGHWFADLREAAGVPAATLHRLRHHVATFLVERGQVLQAQGRLGHGDASTTLREYSYARPLTDRHVADALDAHLDARHDRDPADVGWADP